MIKKEQIKKKREQATRWRLLKTLVLGGGLVTLATWLMFTNHYTLEIAILIGIVTIIWLMDKN